MTLGIIGTAGRREDASRLTPAHWRMMCCVAQTVVTTLGVTKLVSGGAAWADHVAVQLYLDDTVNDLTLHLPARFNMAGSANQFEKHQLGEVANRYHVAFYHGRKVDSLDEIAMAIKKGATVTEEPAGQGFGAFFARNVKVAKAVDTLLAFTFGNGAVLADGGTRHAWDQFATDCQRRFDEAKLHYQESCCGCSNNQPTHFEAYHFDLNSRRLFKTVYTDQKRDSEPKWTETRRPAVPTPSTAEERALGLL